MVRAANYRFLISLIAFCACIPAIAIAIEGSPTQSERVNVSSNNSINSDIERLVGEITRQRAKAEFWDTWNIRLIFVTGITGAMLVITAIGVSRSNGGLSDLSEQLSRAKDHKLQVELKAKDDEIAGITVKQKQLNSMQQGSIKSLSLSDCLGQKLRQEWRGDIYPPATNTILAWL